MPRAEAVATILGLAAEPVARDRFALYAGALDLLAASAAETPLLLLVDDLHLLDEASSEALAFIAGRFGSDGIVLLAGSASDDDLAGAEELRLGDLAVPEAHVLLEACGGTDVAPSVVDRIVDLTGGNPLAVIELATDLTSEQRTGAAAIESISAPAPPAMPRLRADHRAVRA